ncbi:BnaA08g20130D [Brassica napus]|uniref:BnaA08g20130D protein n=2 Tax=Brassica TaxID=3705 RepID=A0A078I8K5_BRANA|nr:BnaA08g20130D [Brassica napus]
MKIRILVDLVSQTLAAMINNKTVREMRASFNLKDDVTSYVEREWQRKHEWAFESDPLPAVEEGIPLDLSLTMDDFAAPLDLTESERESLFGLSTPVNFMDEDPEEDEAAQEDEIAESDESDGDDSN